MYKKIYYQDQAERLLKLLHDHEIPYEVSMSIEGDSRNGMYTIWSFVINSDKILDALMEELYTKN